jgi:hypothetical protein
MIPKFWYVANEGFNKRITQHKGMNQQRHWFEHKGFGLFECSVCGKSVIGNGANDTPYNDMKCVKQ